MLPCNLETASEEKAALALEMLERLKGLLQKLPYENYITLARLLYHLHRCVCVGTLCVCVCVCVCVLRSSLAPRLPRKSLGTSLACRKYSIWDMQVAICNWYTCIRC